LAFAPVKRPGCLPFPFPRMPSSTKKCRFGLKFWRRVPRRHARRHVSKSKTRGSPLSLCRRVLVKAGHSPCRGPRRIAGRKPTFEIPFPISYQPSKFPLRIGQNRRARRSRPAASEYADGASRKWPPWWAGRADVATGRDRKAIGAETNRANHNLIVDSRRSALIGAIQRRG
jgi:hypothetical protein